MPGDNVVPAVSNEKPRCGPRLKFLSNQLVVCFPGARRLLRFRSRRAPCERDLRTAMARRPAPVGLG